MGVTGAENPKFLSWSLIIYLNTWNNMVACCEDEVNSITQETPWQATVLILLLHFSWRNQYCLCFDKSSEYSCQVVVFEAKLDYCILLFVLCRKPMPGILPLRGSSHSCSKRVDTSGCTCFCKLALWQH